MKRIYKYILGAILFILLTFVYIRYFSDYNTTEYQIFKYERGYTIYKLFMKMPKKIKDGYDVKVIEENENFQITYLKDLWSSGPYYYYYINFNHQRTSGILCAPPHYRFRSNKEVTESNYMSYLVDIDLFNEYCNSIGAQTLNNMIDNYINFLHPIGYPHMAIRIRDRNDLKDVLSSRPLNPFNPQAEILDIDAIDLSDQDNAIKYYWFSYAGLFRFSFTLNNQNELKVKANYIGLLGNEAIFM